MLNFIWLILREALQEALRFQRIASRWLLTGRMRCSTQSALADPDLRSAESARNQGSGLKLQQRRQQLKLKLTEGLMLGSG